MDGIVIKMRSRYLALNAGEEAIFQPSVAHALVEQGAAEYVDASDAPSPAAIAPQLPETVSEVEIPENWADLHHMQIIQLAKKISDDATISTKDAASAVIIAEIARRQAADA